jgi:outer membrane immunogenic protein
MAPERFVRRGRVMRFVGLLLAAFAFIQQAHAADMGGILRGAMFELGRPAYMRWGGAYVGGQLGYSSASMDFSNAQQSQVAFILRELALETNSNASEWGLMGIEGTSRPTYGAFLGYNMQWDNAVFGVEVNWNHVHTGMKGASSGSIRRLASPGNGFVYDTTITANAAMDITDYGTARLRAGYAFGNYLGYAFAGLAFGRVDILRSSTVFALEMAADGSGVPFAFGPFTETEKRQALIHGYAFGVGFDWALRSNIFVRAEYEFVDFYPFSDMTVYINSIRGAVGVKF